MKKHETKPTGPGPRATRQASSRSRGKEKTPPRDSSIHPHRSKSPKNTAPLREQADLLQLTHDTLCVIVRNLDDAITFWNRGAEERYGWTASEALGQVAHALLQTQFPQPLEEIRAGLWRDGRWEGELAHTRRDGTRIIVASRWALQRNAQGQPVAILEINNDITERKRAQDQIRQLNEELEQRVAERTAKLKAANGQLEELNAQLEEEIVERQSEILARVQAEERARHLASFPELNPNPVLEVDASGKIIFTNPATQEVLEKLGVDPGHTNTLLPADMDSILTGWDKKSTASYYQEIVVNNRVFGETITLIPRFQVARVYAYNITERKRAEDEIRQLNQALQQRAQGLENAIEELKVSNEELRVANEELEREIIQRKRAEQALRHSESRYHSLFENMLDGFAYCQLLYDDHGHPVDFVYLDVNAAFETLTGLKNVVGKKVTEVIPRIKEEHPELFEIYGRVALTGQPERFVLEFKPLAIWLSLSVYSPERGYFVAAFENITERKRAEEQILKLNQELEQRALALENANEELEVTNEELRVANEELRVANEDLGNEVVERKLAERAALQAREEWERTFDSVPDLIAIINNQHRLVRANRAMAERLGLTPDQCIGQECYRAVHGLEGPPSFCPHVLTLADGQTHAAEMHEPRLKGDFLVTTTPLFDEHGVSIGSVHVARDITERKQAEELSQALNAIHAVIHSTLDLDEIMQRAMREAAQALECDTAAISLRAGDGWHVRYVHGFPKEVIGAQMNDDQERHAVLAIQTKKPVAVDDAFNDEQVNRDHMRKWGVRSVLVVPLIVKNQAIGVIFFNYQQSAFTFRDAHIDFGTQLAASLSLALENARLFENLEKELAQRKLTEERILRLNEDLEQRADELEIANEELERLATSLALDLRSPLVSLHSVSRLIAQDYGAQLPPHAQELFQLIDANAEEMDQLTQGLLQLMRVTRQTLRKQELNPEETVRAALAELQPECEGRQVEFTVDHLPSCRADPLLLKQVWVNLLSNALKFTRPREQARIEIGARPERDRVAYFVKDNGVGFDMSYAGTIFRAFQRYHHAEDWGGSGVGLAIVESIVRRHGGRVWAEGAVDQGATVYFTLT